MLTGVPGQQARMRFHPAMKKGRARRPFADPKGNQDFFPSIFRIPSWGVKPANFFGDLRRVSLLLSGVITFVRGLGT